MQKEVQESVSDGLTSIDNLSREELIDIWNQAHQRPPPKGLSRRLLEYSAAYHLQVKAFGGLKPTTRRKLRHKPTQIKKTISAAKESQRLSVGTRLIREWHDRTHTIEVLENGFLYNDETYNSLSKIARVITGTRWSGPRFFGL